MDRKRCCEISWGFLLKKSPAPHWRSSAGKPKLPLSKLPTDSNPTFVSRGGHKIRDALNALAISVQGKVCLDVGSSTGGFTDCLLQAGAQSVWAVDVGWGLLDMKLRNDSRVHVLERTNFRFMDLGAVAEKPTFVTVD